MNPKLYLQKDNVFHLAAQNLKFAHLLGHSGLMKNYAEAKSESHVNILQVVLGLPENDATDRAAPVSGITTMSQQCLSLVGRVIKKVCKGFFSLIPRLISRFISKANTSSVGDEMRMKEHKKNKQTEIQTNKQQELCDRRVRQNCYISPIGTNFVV